MKLNKLSNEEMLALGWGWSNDAEIRAAVEAHPLGGPMLDQVAIATTELSEQRGRRHDLQVELDRLGEAIKAGSETFLHKSRALHHYLTGLIEDCEDKDEAAEFRRLKSVLFPENLGVLQSSYMSRHGLMRQVEHVVTDDMLARLDSISVGRRTLGDVYRDWVAASHVVGDAVQERLRLKASIKRGGTQAASIDLRRLRHRWIRIVHLFLNSLEVLNLSDEILEMIMVPLERTVRRARYRPRAGDATRASQHREQSNVGAAPEAVGDGSADAVDAPIDAAARPDAAPRSTAAAGRGEPARPPDAGRAGAVPAGTRLSESAESAESPPAESPPERVFPPRDEVS